MAAAALMTGACDESRLDIQEKGVVDVSDYYKTDEEILGAEASLYTEMLTGMWRAYNDISIMINSLGDDMISGGSVRGDRPYYDEFSDFTISAGNIYLRTMFQKFYSFVFSSNSILENVDENGDDVAKMVRAEAKVFRAWAYYYLTALWGTPPIVDHTLDIDEYDQPNASTADLWAFVEKDLTEAIESGELPEKSSVDDKQWRVTKQFAQALLGRAYMWEKKYSEAAAVYEEIISSGLYSLYTGPYDMILRNRFSPENMFEINRTLDPNNYQKFSDHHGLMVGIRTSALRHVGEDGTLEAPTVTNCGLACPGFGFLVPTPKIYNDFVAEEGEDGYRLCNSILTLSQLKDSLGLVIPEGGSYYGYGYFDWKLRVMGDMTADGQAGTYILNTVLLRYAEVLLYAAEANLAIGNQAKADEYVNLVRARAKLDPKTGVTLEDIQTEDELEFFGEGHRYLDLCRWGSDVAYEALKDKGQEDPRLFPDGTVTYSSTGFGDTAGFKKNKNELLPFPETEVNLNKNIKQNTGY